MAFSAGKAGAGKFNAYFAGLVEEKAVLNTVFSADKTGLFWKKVWKRMHCNRSLPIT
jgi:hypothetical protein